MSAQSDKILGTTSPQQVISAALKLLRARHGVSESVAFEMLVTGSTDSHENVRESASRIVAESHKRP
jgi:AmiR/NasT family two-component response regulator